MNLVARLRKIAGHELDHPAAEAADELVRLQKLVDNAVILSAKISLLRAGLEEVAGLDCSRYTKHLDAQKPCSCISCKARKTLRTVDAKL